MAQVRNVLRGVAHCRQGSPAAVLTALDEAMRDLAVDTLATAVMGTVEQRPEDAARGLRLLRWSNAGHPPPLLVSPDGEVTVLQDEPDLLLGLDPTTPRADHVHVLLPGSTVVLYTDGLIERRGVSIDQGIDWLVRTVADAAPLPLEEFCDRLLAELCGAVEDDVALLAVRAHPEDRPRPPEAGAVRIPEGHSALSRTRP
jgi:serine phosphatase RsbU (regulator of sigma subunit)